MRSSVSIFFILLTGNFLAQKESGNSYNLFWLAYSNNVQLNSKWNVNTDIQHRTKNGFETQSISAIRTALGYKVNRVITVSSGAAHFRYFIKNDLTRGEWRPYQEMLANLDFGTVKITNRVRTEERFNQVVVNDVLTSNYKFNWRFRYKIDLEFPLFKQDERVHSLSFGNEFMINVGKTIVNPYDQNRSSVSFNYQLSKNVKLQFQYIYIVQYIASKDNYDRISAFRLNFQHTVKL